jgi:hypothetical protein
MALDKKDLPEHHLKYEIDMLLFDAQSLISRKNNENNQTDPLQNALLESYLIHLRNIIDFLWVLPTHKNDIYAGSFIPKGNPISQNFSKERDKVSGDSITSIKDRINKQISHLTYTRTNNNIERQWDTRGITCCISKYLMDYLGKCSMNECYKESIKGEVSGFVEAHCNKNIPMATENNAKSFTTATVSIMMEIHFPFSGNICREP